MKTVNGNVCRLWFAICSYLKLPFSNFKPQAVFLIAVAGLFSSCLKEEEPVTPPNLQGNLKTAQIPLGKDYDKQFFFDLGSNQIVSSNLKSAWDLGFECGLNGSHIILNTSKLMFAWNSGDTAFSSVTSDSGAVWKWDVASGNLDSTAVGEWGSVADGNVASFRTVYLINRGKDALANPYGVKKIIFEGLTDNTYSFRYANPDGTDAHSFQIKKDEDYSFVYFSFDDGGKKVSIAPEKNSWDLEFTQYTHIFSETPDNIPQPDTIIPYLVTGVLQNRAGTGAAEDFNTPFADITLEEAIDLPFNETAIDVIGYDWKYFNFTEVSYTVLPKKIYIVRDNEGFLYKLRFIDFYNDLGEKGYPKFEFQRL